MVAAGATACACRWPLALTSLASTPCPFRGSSAAAGKIQSRVRGDSKPQTTLLKVSSQQTASLTSLFQLLPSNYFPCPPNLEPQCHFWLFHPVTVFLSRYLRSAFPSPGGLQKLPQSLPATRSVFPTHTPDHVTCHADFLCSHMRTPCSGQNLFCDM